MLKLESAVKPQTNQHSWGHIML